ncbi:hypothetical protein PPERSA_12190 [Pseudocohnilembus persalinus]|uniref:Uncharacterized protein n=1 Tax=Pseudocohnilembus persalinus TaxID=266149 RepID=A0A0V0R8L2_PSEPJ|nr:hypothetical protein PPERSA_12190 [Pseudocohnilembus persalinus]|eukprot:KRX10839.1 hypothetical protein PPERSA_12190 [Pseudocohnilembus persalinus]
MINWNSQIYFSTRQFYVDNGIDYFKKNLKENCEGGEQIIRQKAKNFSLDVMENQDKFMEFVWVVESIQQLIIQNIQKLKDFLGVYQENQEDLSQENKNEIQKLEEIILDDLTALYQNMDMLFKMNDRMINSFKCNKWLFDFTGSLNNGFILG